MEQSWAGIALQAIPRQKWDFLGGEKTSLWWDSHKPFWCFAPKPA